VREEGTSVHRVLFFGAVRASSIQEVRGSRRNARYERHKKELCSFFAFSYHTWEEVRYLGGSALRVGVPPVASRPQVPIKKQILRCAACAICTALTPMRATTFWANAVPQTLRKGLNSKQVKCKPERNFSVLAP
jgi:hypothetical protein